MNTDERLARLRGLVALEIARIVDDLELRRDFLLRMWSKFRDRQPFLDTLFNRWHTVGFPDLAELRTDEVVACDAFFRKVDEVRLYLAYTQDMPTTLAERLDSASGRLRELGEVALEALGGAPDRPEVLDASTREGFLLAFPRGDDEPVTAMSQQDDGAELHTEARSLEE